MDATSFRVVLVLALLFLLTAGVLFYLDYRLYSAIAALIAVFLFYRNGYQSFSMTHFVSYNNKSITISLMGNKTFGFMFKEVELLDLSEKGLYIKVKDQEAFTLSRKRYENNSLEKLHHIIKEKTKANERR